MSVFTFTCEHKELKHILISAIKAHQMLKKGCEDFLAHVKMEASNPVRLEVVHVVNQFSNIFLKDLPKILINREVEFTIDLLLSTNHISLPSYRVNLAELREPKAQFQELVNKRFFQPNTSP